MELYIYTFTQERHASILRRLTMRLLLLVLIDFFLLACSSAHSQEPSDLHGTFRTALERASDSLMQDQRNYVDTLVSHGDLYFHQSSWALRMHADSLLVATGDSLDASRSNSVRLLGLDMEHSMSGLRDRCERAWSRSLKVRKGAACSLGTTKVMCYLHET